MSCPLPSIKYSSLQKRIDASGKRIPLVGTIEVTARCNQFCSHCYINKPLDDRNELQKELSTEDFCAIIDQISDAGCLFLLLTGGEPFIRPDFMDIYKHAKKRGLLVTLFTNGTAITRDIAKELSIWRPRSMEITLYGMTEETYEGVTGVIGSYERCMKGIDLLIEYNIPLELKTMVLKTNMHEIDDMKLFAGEKGLKFRLDAVLNMGIDDRQLPESVRLSPREALQFDITDEKRSKGWETYCEEVIGPQERSEYIYNCCGGIYTFHIDAYGQMSPCIMVRNTVHDLKGGTFNEGFYNFIPEVISRKRTRDTKCVDCELAAICSQCPGMALMETGDEEEPVESMCELAKLRASSFYKNTDYSKINEGNYSI